MLECVSLPPLPPDLETTQCPGFCLELPGTPWCQGAPPQLTPHLQKAQFLPWPLWRCTGPIVQAGTKAADLS